MSKSRLHVCIPRGYYIGQLRLVGCRRWRTVTGRCKSYQSALSAAARKMRYEDKRARVLFIDTSGWYEPTLIIEAVK